MDLVQQDMSEHSKWSGDTFSILWMEKFNHLNGPMVTPIVSVTLINQYMSR